MNTKLYRKDLFNATIESLIASYTSATFLKKLESIMSFDEYGNYFVAFDVVVNGGLILHTSNLNRAIDAYNSEEYKKEDKKMDQKNNLKLVQHNFSGSLPLFELQIQSNISADWFAMKTSVKLADIKEFCEAHNFDLPDIEQCNNHQDH